MVTGVSPASGPVPGNTPVTVTGSGFTGATAVSFGPAAASGLSVVSDTEVTVTSPPACAGGWDGGCDRHHPGGPLDILASREFTYQAAGQPPVVTGVSPASGWESGNTPVTVTGVGFTGATVLVTFGPGGSLRTVGDQRH